MKSLTKKVFRTGSFTMIVVIMALFLLQSSASGGIFGMGEYPGGALKAVFRISEPNSEAPARNYTMKVEPDGEGYDIMENVTSPGRKREDVSTAFGASGGAGAAGSRYEEDDSPNIDLSPLSTLDDRNVKIEPDENYILPDGARLVTRGKKTIAGIEVVMGTFVHSNYPNQRVNMAFADRKTRDLLLFPALFEREEKGEVEMKIELVEFSYRSG